MDKSCILEIMEGKDSLQDWSAHKDISNAIYTKIEGSKSIDNELIRSYNEFFQNQYQKHNFEKSWDTVSINLKIINRLITDKFDIEQIVILLCNTFKLFIDIHEKYIKTGITLNDILLYELKNCHSIDSDILLHFLHFKLYTLQIFSIGSESYKMQQQEIVDVFQYNSQFYTLLNQVNQLFPGMAFSITSIFIQLSLTTKTIYKLTFLIIATHYSMLTANIRSKLFSKIEKDSMRMMNKSDAIVYKFTAKHLFSLYMNFKQRNMDLNIIKNSIKSYYNAELKYKLGIDWKLLYISDLSSSELSNSLENVKISENIELIINGNNPSILLSSKQSMKSLILVVKSLNINDVESHKTIGKIILFISKNINDYNSLFNIFDLMTLKLKDMECNVDNSAFLHSNLVLMSDALYPKDQTKRLTNFSRLFYHFAGVLIDLYPTKSIPFWNSFIHIERKLSSSKENAILNLKRFNYISTIQIAKNNFQIAIILQTLFLDSMIEPKYSPFEYDKILKKDFESSLKIITKCTIFDKDLISLIFEYIENESLIIAILLVVIENIEISHSNLKEKTISHIIILAKEELKDTGLFLYFLSQVSTIVDFPINFRNSLLAFNSDSIIISLEGLVVSHLYLLQTFSNCEIVSDILFKSYNSMLKWINHIDENFTDYEFLVLNSLFQSLKYNEAYIYCSNLLESYLNVRSEKLSKENKSIIFTNLLDTYLKLENYQACEHIIMMFQIDKMESVEDINLQLSILQYSIQIKNSAIQNTFFKIVKLFTEIDTFSIEKQSDKYKAIELLMLHAKFCKITGLYNEGDHLKSITNINRSLCILQSVFKNFLLFGPKVPTLNLNYKSILKIRFSYEMLDSYDLIINQYSIIGFGKELEHYLNEINIFVKVQPSPNLKYRFNLKLINYNLFKNSISKAVEHFEFVQLNKEKLMNDGNKLIDIYNLIVCENYARKSGDVEKAKIISQSLDNLIFNFLDSSNVEFIGKMTIIKQWVDAIWRRNDFSDGDKIQCVSQKNKRKNNPIEEIIYYYKCLKDLQKGNNINQNSILFYPLMENTHPVNVKNNIIDDLKACNIKLVVDLQENFELTSPEISRNKIDMFVNCFVEILKHEKNIKMNTELNQMISLNEKYKFWPFKLEKEFSMKMNKQKCFLPDIPSKMDRLLSAPILTDNLSLKNFLPIDWIAVTIDYNVPTNSLAITRYDDRYDLPLFIDIPLKEKENKHSFNYTLSSLRSIIDESDKTTLFEVTCNIKSYDEKLKWWETRKLLDKRLENLLTMIDLEWFGGFNSLFQFNKFNITDVQKFKAETIKLIISCTPQNFDIQFIRQRLNSIHDGIYELFLNIDNISIDKINNLLVFLLETSINNEFLKLMSDNLINISKKLKVSILSYSEKFIIDYNSKNHLVLIPGPNCTHIPWESIPSLRKKSVTRMPTVYQLKDYLIKYKSLIQNGIDSCKGYYVINPGGDLQRTQENLAPRFENLDGWEGSIGEAPKESDILHAFDEKNIFIYAGHGGGEQYIKSKYIKSRNYIPPSLLLGCSSGLLKGDGYINPYGTAYNYINGGCPMLLVNLWDVTDKDIDMFTVDALKKWGFFVDYDSFDTFDLCMENLTFAQSVAKSRDVCKLKYLNGASPIVYGLPLQLETV